MIHPRKDIRLKKEIISSYLAVVCASFENE